MAAFYNQADQDIYKTNKFMPQSRFLLNAPKPVVEEKVTESFGIPNTNAFNNSGGNDFSVYNPDPNSIVNRNYNPYPFRQAESPIDEGSDPSYFTPPEPTGLGKIAQFASNFMPGAGIARFVGDYLPPNQRAIMENQLSRQGVMVNNIGQIVQGDGGYDTAGNVMAGYNANKLTAESFDKRIAMAKDKMSDENKGARIAALEEAKQNFLDAENESDEIYDFKKKEKQLNKKNNVINRFLTKRKEKKAAKATADAQAAAVATGGGGGGSYRGRPGGNTGSGNFSNIDNSGKNYGPHSKTSSAPNYTSKDDNRESYRGKDGGRVKYFFGGRVNFKDGGLASIL